MKVTEEIEKLALKLSQKLENVSTKMIEVIEAGDFTQLSTQADNRDRLMKLLAGILDILDQNENIDRSASATYAQISASIQKSIALDEDVLSLLENNKEKIKNEISQVFKNKNKVKGYNLKNLRT
jgi:uncharacterized protein (UPF0335 family)